MSDFVLLAGGTAFLLIALSLIPSGNREKGHFLDSVENPRLRRLAGLAVAMLSGACLVLSLILFGAALVE